jgi:hypothetical protein
MEHRDHESTGVHRRTLVKGVAWATPAVVVAQAAPAFALSTVPPTFRFLGACKSPGQSCKSFPKGYQFTFEVCNNSSEDVYLYSVSYTVSGTNLTLTHQSPNLPYRLPAGQCQIVEFRADSSNSANQTFDANMQITWGHTPVPGTDPTPHPPLSISFTVPGTPPVCQIPGCSTTAKESADAAASSVSSSTSSDPATSSSSSTSGSSSATSPGTQAPAAPAEAPSAPAPSATPEPAATPSSAGTGG